MLNLNERRWETRAIKDVFTISSGKRLESRNRRPGDRPFIGALDNSNGIVQFVTDANESLDRNVLGVNYNGNGMGIGFYHPYECVFSDDVKRFHLKDAKDSEELALFMKTLIARQRGKFGYVYKFNAKRMAATRIMLLVDGHGRPDYRYMTQYVRERRDALLTKYRVYAQRRLARLGDEDCSVGALADRHWSEFTLEEIFTISPGKRLETRNKKPGKRPFIGATDNGNGITGFVANDNASRDNNVLGVNYNGAPCIAFYHPYECLFTDDVKRLHLKGHEDNELILLFLATIITQQKSKYGYGYKFNEQRMLRQVILLPVTDSGEPDYEYMERYARNMMIRKYRQYLDYLDR